MPLRSVADLPDVTWKRWRAGAVEIANDHFEKWGFVLAAANYQI